MKTREDLIKLGLEGVKADEVMMLESEMLKRAVRFQFRKQNGELREAVGTLKRDRMIQQDGTLWEPVGESKPEHPMYVKYWDLNKMAWRQFSILNLAAVEG